MKNNLAPIAFFCYNRPEHTRAALQALKNNYLSSDSVLIAFCDGYKDGADKGQIKKVDEVRTLLEEEQWCGKIEVVIRSSNLGCRENIRSGISEIVNQHGRVIVVEDDVVTSPGFLTYMNNALGHFERDPSVLMIGAYTPPIKLNTNKDYYFLRFACPWGWATWAVVSEFNFNESQNFNQMIQDGQWGVSWYATLFLNNGLGVYPSKSLVRNVGFDGSGVHCGTGYWYDIKKLNDKEIKFLHDEIIESSSVRKKYEKFYRGTDKSGLLEKIKYKYNLELKKLRNR